MADWEPSDPNRTWHLSMWTAQKPVPMLEREILTRFADGLRRCLEEAGSGFRQDAACFVNGYCYMATSTMPEDDVNARRERHFARAAQLEAEGTDIYEADVRPMLEGQLGRLRTSKRAAKNRASAVDHLDAAMAAATDAMGNWHWRMWPTPFDWKATFTEVTGRPEREASILLQGVGHATARLVRQLRELARHLQAEPELLNAAERGDREAVGAFPDFDRGFQRLLRDHGRRTGYGLGSNVNFHTPTWSMRPEMVLGLIAGYAKSNLDAVEASERKAKRERTALARRIRTALASEPDRLARFDAAYARAVSDVQRGENSNHLIEQEHMGTMREAIDAIGRRLVDDGLIDEPDDAYHLSLDELRAAPELRTLVAERKREIEVLSDLTPPPVVGAGAANATLPGRAGHPPREEAAKGAEEDGVLRGIAVAKGVVKGRARVVASTAEPPDVEPGDILIAPDAGPAWTPVFPIVGALVLDGGHIADHAAIMCRDLGIPAVMRTTSATTRIPDGAMVTVDGDEGTVALVL